MMMHLYFGLILTFSIAGSVIAGADKSEVGAIVRLLPSATNSVGFTVDASKLEIGEILQEATPRQTFELQGEGIIYEKGKPILPAVSRYVVVPGDAGLALEIDPGPAEVLRDRLPPEICDDTEITTDGKSIGSGLFPSQIAVMSEPLVIRGVRLVKLTTYPVQYDPESNEYVLHNEVTASVRFTGEPPINPAFHPVRHNRSQTFLKMIRALAINGDEVGRDDPDRDHAPEYVGHYLVVVHASVLRWAGPFIEWRRKEGYKVDVLSVPANNSRDGNWIRARIQERYNAYLDEDIDPFDLIMIIGDHEGYGGNIPAAENVIATYRYDWDYARLEGGNNDDLADVGVARWIAGGEAQVNLNVGRTLAYEMNPPFNNPQWMTRGGVFSQKWSGSWHISLHTNVRWGVEALKAQGMQDVRAYEDFNNQDQGGANVSNWLLQQFNAGASIIMGRSQPYSFNVTSCQNNGINPIFINYGGHQQGITWGIMRRFNNGQTVGPVAATNIYESQVTATNTVVWLEIVNALVQKDLPLGWARVFSSIAPSLYLAGGDGISSQLKNNSTVYGDAGLQPWLGVPEVPDCEFPSSINTGMHSLNLHITKSGDDDEPLEGATVAVYAPGSIPAFASDDYDDYDDMQLWLGTTDVEGNVRFAFDENVEFVENTNLYVTISGRKIKPLIHEVRLEEPDPGLSLINYAIEEQGNGDGDLNPGESFGLSLTVANTDDEDAEDVIVRVSSRSQYLEFEQQSVELGSLTAEEEIETEPFVIHLSPATQDGISRPVTRPIIDVEILSANTILQSAIIIEPSAPHLALVQVVNGITVPDEIFSLDLEIKNIGSMACEALTARVRTLGPGIGMISPNCRFAALNPNRTGRITGDRLRLSGSKVVPPGYLNPMELILETESGFRDTVEFTLKISSPRRNSPQGPDNYGYICYDNTDEDWDLAPEYDWIEINPDADDPDFEGDRLGFRDQAPQDIGEAMTVDLPIAFQFYNREYEEITIATNGFISVGEQPGAVNFMNWPLDRAIGGGAGMIAPLWDWLDLGQNGRVFTFYDEDHGYFIIEWSQMKYFNYQQANLTFQVILKDADLWPTPSGDSQILFQYRSFSSYVGNQNDNPYASVGISSPDGRSGISYFWNNSYPITAAEINDQRAILFIASSTFRAGILYGSVTDVATGAPIEGATVYTQHGFVGVTDADGLYRIDPALAEVAAWIRCQANGYNDSLLQDVAVRYEDSLEVTFQLLHPEASLSDQSFILQLDPEQETVLGFSLTNTGNGPLSFKGGKRLTEVVGGEPGNLRLTHAVGRIADDERIEGVTFANDRFVVAGTDGDSVNMVYILNRDGELIQRFQQFATTRYGYKDLEWDGDLVWASGDSMVFGFTPEGDLVESFEGPLSPNSHIAWDSDQQFLWISGITSDIFAYDRAGNAVGSILDRCHLRIYGLAYNSDDPDGHNLYLLTQNGAENPILFKMDTETNDTMRIMSIDLPDSSTSLLSASLTTEFDDHNWTLMTIINYGAFSDKLGIYQIEANTRWLDLDHWDGTLQTGETDEFQLTISSEDLAITSFAGELYFAHNAAGDTAFVTVELEVLGDMPAEPFSLLEPPDNDTLTALPSFETDILLPPIDFSWRGTIDPNMDQVSYLFGIGVAGVERTFALPDTFISLAIDTLNLPLAYDLPVVWQVWAISGNDTVACFHPFNLFLTPNDFRVTDPEPPVKFGLASIYPNPFNSRTTLKFGLDHHGYASLKLYDLAGREVVSLFEGNGSPGLHTVTMNGEKLVTGIYWIRLEAAGSGSEIRKLTLLK